MSRASKRARHLASVAFVFPAFTAGSAVLSATLPLVNVLSRDPRRATERSQRIMGKGLAAVAEIFQRLDLVRSDRHAHRVAAESLSIGPCVLVANHPTLADTILVLASYERTCVVAKRAHAERLLVAPALRAAGHIIEGGDDFESVRAVMESCLGRLREGYRVLMFPEGTRSPESGLGTFHRLPFEVAARAGVPVVPLVLRCDPPALKRGQPWHAFPVGGVDYEIEQLAPVMVGTGRKQVRDAALRVRELIARAEAAPRLRRAERVVTGARKSAGASAAVQAMEREEGHERA